MITFMNYLNRDFLMKLIFGRKEEGGGGRG